jgi:hypothetical protein
VDKFLAHLPEEDEPLGSITPDVRGLIGIGAGDADRASYSRHLLKKHGR